jgi:hypothetical protein
MAPRYDIFPHLTWLVAVFKGNFHLDSPSERFNRQEQAS